MVYQPAAGARDLLPLDVVQKGWIEDKLQQVFHRWGYHRIITSTLERMDTLMAGGAIQSRTVIQLQNSEDEELGLRPELTASIARAAVTILQRQCISAPSGVKKQPSTGILSVGGGITRWWWFTGKCRDFASSGRLFRKCGFG
jgi:Histidyl-tRNA synthetase